MVPSDRVAPILRRALEARKHDPIDWVAAYVGDLERQLYRWENESEYVGFDTVDRCFCQSGLDVWHVWTEELGDLYYAITFHEVTAPAPNRCQRRGCSNTFVRHKGGRRQKFCSRRCRDAVSKRRHQGQGTSGRYGTRHGACPKGHDRSPNNVGIDNLGRQFCRECARVRAKEWRRKRKVQSQRAAADAGGVSCA